jgi:hypothetical protein
MSFPSYIKKFLLIFLLFAAFATPIEADESETPAVSRFRERFSLRILCDYNFMMIKNSQFDDEPLISNRPVDVGLGFGYDSLFTLFGVSWDFSWDFKYSLPFTTNNEHPKSKAFSTGLDLFPENWWLAASLNYYNGFTQDLNDDKKDISIDLTILDIYISALYMLTSNGDFSPRSAYFLDRRQRKSAGSMIAGGRLQMNSVEDNDSVMNYDDDKRQLNSIWVDIGYTYSWIFDNGLFCNLWGVTGIAYGRESAKDDNVLLPEFDGKFAFGYIGEKWAWNIVLLMDYAPILYSDIKEEKITAAFKILTVRRF